MSFDAIKSWNGFFFLMGVGAVIGFTAGFITGAALV